MLNFEFKKSGRKCIEDQKDFSPGEVFYSALVETKEGGSERHDYCLEHWDEPPDDCIGWWKAKVPELGKGKVFWAPRKVLLAYFEHALQNEQQQDMAFIAGLLLVQKKILVLDDDETDPGIMRLRNRLDKTGYDVPVFNVSGKRLSAIQAELAERLFMDEPVDEFDDEEEEANA